jgi:K+-transporting ATPase KdpF subunit
MRPRRRSGRQRRCDVDTDPLGVGGNPEHRGATVNLESIAGLVIAAGLFAYLVVTLIWPERF